MRSRGVTRRCRVVESPEVMRDRVGLAEHHHQGVPRLAREQGLRQRGAALDAVEQAGQRAVVPARPGANLLEVGERQPAHQPAQLGVERTRVDEGPVDARRDGTVEAAHHDAVHRLGRIRRRDGQHRDATSARRQPRPQRRRAALAAVDEAHA